MPAVQGGEMMLINQAPTACDAFHAHVGAGRAEAQRERILAFIRSRGGDWSIGEVAHALDLEKSTVSARLNELLHDGKLVAKAKRHDRLSNILVRPVALPVAQGELFNA